VDIELKESTVIYKYNNVVDRYKAKLGTAYSKIRLAGVFDISSV